MGSDGCGTIFTMPSLDITNIAWEQLPVLWVSTSIEGNVDNFGCLGLYIYICIYMQKNAWMVDG